MPAYNFKARFADLVELGRKPHTIRQQRKNPTHPGDTLYLYTGMRTRACRLLRTEHCSAVIPIQIHKEGIMLGGRCISHDQRESLAHHDGFPSWGHMRAFFDAEYGLPILGMELICWHPRDVRTLQADIADLIASANKALLESRWEHGAPTQELP